jgi:hypothetical protein
MVTQTPMIIIHVFPMQWSKTVQERVGAISHEVHAMIMIMMDIRTMSTILWQSGIPMIKTRVILHPIHVISILMKMVTSAVLIFIRPILSMIQMITINVFH